MQGTKHAFQKGDAARYRLTPSFFRRFSSYMNDCHSNDKINRAANTIDCLNRKAKLFTEHFFKICCSNGLAVKIALYFITIDFLQKV